jgi:hypothetical protein
MRRTEHLGARVVTTIGVLATLVYLGWRAAFSLRGSELWLSLPVLLIEAIAFAGSAVLAWALWPAPGADVVRRSGVKASSPLPSDVVVRVNDQAEHEVRATLLAARHLVDAQQVIVIDLHARPAIAALAIEFGAMYAATDPADRNGLRVALATVGTPQFLLLDAGDVPAGDIIARLGGDLTDPRVAVVQGLGASGVDDSAEHGPNRRHELLFERSSLNPALGARGAAIWLGSGSLVRVAALREAPVNTERALVAQWSVGAALAAAGWRLTAPGDVAVFAHRTVHSEAEVFDDRVERARAARRLVVGRRGALRGRFEWRQRLAFLAWSVRPLSGLRRMVFVALLATAVLSGTVPFRGEQLVLVCAWLPSFVYTSLGISLLSGWTLRPGDRARWSLHSIGSSWSSVRNERTERPARPARTPIIALPSRQYGAGLSVVVVVLSVVVLLRGVSDRFTHTLGSMPRSVLMALLLVTLWTLGLSLDLLRVLGSRRQLRRTARVASLLPATIGERTVSIVDLTSVGAGVLSQTGIDLQERAVLETVITTTSGVTSVRIPGIVRNVSVLSNGDYRIGVEFGDRDEATSNALAEFCTVEPMWERLGVMPGQSAIDKGRMIYLEEPPAEASPGRMLVRAVAMIALLGVVGSAAPATAAASAPLDHLVTGTIVEVGAPPLADPDAPAVSVPDSLVDVDEPIATTEPPVVESAAPEGVAGVVVVGVCSLAPGPDDAWGTADDVYDAPVESITDEEGRYQLTLTGEACWAVVAPPEGFVSADVADSADVTDEAATVVVSALDVSASAGRTTVELQRVEAVVSVPNSSVTGPRSEPGVESDRLGLRLRRAASEWNASPVPGRAPQVLPEPVVSQLAETGSDVSSLSLFVLLLAALLGSSLLLGLARPRSRAAR